MKRYLITENQYRRLVETLAADVLYHGGPEGILDKPIVNNNYKVGRWFTTEPNTAKMYGPIVYSVKLTINKPFVVDAGGAYYYNIPTPDAMKDWTMLEDIDTDGIAEFAWKHGYDGAIMKNVLEGNGNGHVSDVYVVFDQHQVQELPEKWRVETYSMSGAKFKELKPY